MKQLFFILGVLTAVNSVSYNNIRPATLGFEHRRLESVELGEVNYYLTKDSINKQKPLLVYLDGSGSFPLFQKMDAGIGSTVVIDFQKLRDKFKILLISKPGVPFADSVGRDNHGFPVYKTPSEYTERMSLEWRVQSANLIINELIKNKSILVDKIIAFGFSEGAQVVPKLASINKNITHIMLFGGNGLNQLFDPIISARLKSSRGQISEFEAQSIIDSLFQIYSEIYRHPESTAKRWWGHTYKRWASFAQTDPYKFLVNLDIPIYIANGSLDENSVLSADYIQLEFIKHKKNNLTYKTYPNYDHQFNEIITKNGQFIKSIPHLDRVLRTAFEWLDKQ